MYLLNIHVLKFKIILLKLNYYHAQIINLMCSNEV